MTLEVPNLFIILAFAFFFGPMFFLALYGCLASFWRVKRKKKERHAETFITYYPEEQYEESCFGSFPDNDCDRDTCMNMCDDVQECISKTKQEGDEE